MSDLTDTTSGDVAARIVGVHERIQRLTGELYGLVAELESSRAHDGADAGLSVRTWLSQTLGISPRAAGALVGTARSLRDHAPDALDALCEGAVTAESARTIAGACARVARYEDAVRSAAPAHRFTDVDGVPFEPVPRAEADLVSLAMDRRLNDADVARAARTVVELMRPDDVEARRMAAEADRSFHLTDLPDGMWRLDALLDEVTGLRLKTLHDAAMGRPESGDERTPAQRRHDAFSEIVSLACRLSDDQSELPTGQRSPHVRLTVNIARLAASFAGRFPIREARDWLQLGVHTDFDSNLSPAGLRELACGASVRALLTDTTGDVLAAGRTRRFPSAVQRDAVIARDRQCRYPGCGRPPRWIDIHHRIPWYAGGNTDTENLVSLCTRHHHQIESQGLTLIPDAAGNEHVVPLADLIPSSPDDGALAA